ncbi:dihydroneopterin triphosphate pyrophosphatase [Corynebacterium ciconiae DSM 44920]|uniref:NUDIX hydrolase n=1 Tax=Corynebacterium ciconiae TaxID=227319 RepID=UPI000367B6C5|nr:NUDIX domain-containing protein [Corynebacterium ciconiae]WKD60721.1 dihydroneopterin triphosphate pyrophosphatase [Corynebacterium ciconiae DSM 44920]
MPTPDFIVSLREKIGHEPLLLPGVTAIVLRDSTTGSFLNAPEVLLVRRADSGAWTPVTGIVDPGEEPTTTAEREVKEETCLDARVVALLGCGAVGPVTYPNGDVTSYIDTAYRLELVGEADPAVGDEESVDVGWFSIAQLPSSVAPRFRLLIADAVAQRRRPQGYSPRMGYHKRDKPAF